MYKKILVATDGSKLSKKAVKAASDLAADFDAVLTLVRVVPPYEQTFVDGSSILSTREMEEIEKEWVQLAERSLDQLLKSSVDKHISVNKVVTKSSNVSEALLKVAKKAKSDLIVMASHGRGGIKRLLIGSETLHVLMHSEIPVLVIR
ncbi:universal stress protein [Aquabacterium sp.]|uniref:universal stress protein n=1 Tax=Aquabacterium sp. TaxID=1872578 RepID=UPI002E2FACF9|nr:universal stress protein [Aquabacterium sp.]HEX5311989.1 universal stress protein [Aquabacterium sp.]